MFGLFCKYRGCEEWFRFGRRSMAVRPSHGPGNISIGAARLGKTYRNQPCLPSGSANKAVSHQFIWPGLRCLSQE